MLPPVAVRVVICGLVWKKWITSPALFLPCLGRFGKTVPNHADRSTGQPKKECIQGTNDNINKLSVSKVYMMLTIHANTNNRLKDFVKVKSKKDY